MVKEEITEARRRNMRAIRGKNTRPELRVRKLLYGLGYRYRVHCRDLPGRPDIVFKGRRKVIEVRGCFWHQHGCKNSVLPVARRDFWRAKLAANVSRDQRNCASLRSLGWATLVIWECEIAQDRELKGRLKRFLGPTGSRPASKQSL
jgi:DNA mismatch endonuclease Vsr